MLRILLRGNSYHNSFFGRWSRTFAVQIPKKELSNPMEAAYDPIKVEKGWNEWWVSQGYFRANPAQVLTGRKKPFVVLIPPPNVTGSLHAGHALFLAIQDAIIRYKRMRGYEALWIPGTDHAGIATQTVVEKCLMRDENKSRHDVGREEFLKRVWEWRNNYGERILNQFKIMGSSLDWERCFFTMDESRSMAVTEAFCRLAEKGIIFRNSRLVNWCCTLRTALSDIEVDHEEISEPRKIKVPGYKEEIEIGYLTKFSYRLKENPSKELVVSTTRLETMLGDVAVAVHPEDKRYQHWIGKELIHPFIKNRTIKVIADY